MMDDTQIKLMLDLIEQMYVAWGIDCNAQPADELEKRALAFLAEHRQRIVGEESLKAIAHEIKMERIA